MAGLNDTDIRLDTTWQLTQARTGDAPVCTDLECLRQDIQLEAITQPGEIFYDLEWGWGLLEFIHSEDDEFVRLEISERIKEKLGRRPEVDTETIGITIVFQDDYIRVHITLQFVDSSQKQSVNVELSRISVEVNVID